MAHRALFAATTVRYEEVRRQLYPGRRGRESGRNTLEEELGEGNVSIAQAVSH